MVVVDPGAKIHGLGGITGGRDPAGWVDVYDSFFLKKDGVCNLSWLR